MSSLLIPYLLLVVSYYKTVRTHPGTCVDYQPHCSENEKQEAIERETYGKEKNFKIVDIGYPCRYCIYVPINCIVGIILHISNIVSIVRDPNTSKSVHALNISLSLSSTVIMFSMGIAVTSLLWHHISMILINTTSIENIEKMRYSCLSHHKAPEFPIYDKGTYQNIQEVMGKNICEWFIPITSTHKSIIDDNPIGIEIGK
ncbi:Palmitoyltransferase [Entamoeba marina]